MKYIYLIILFFCFTGLGAQNFSVSFTGPGLSGEKAGTVKTYKCKVTNNNSSSKWVRISYYKGIITDVIPAEAYIESGRNVEFGIIMTYPCSLHPFSESFDIDYKDENGSWKRYSTERYNIHVQNIPMTSPVNLRVSNLTSTGFRVHWSESTGGNCGIRSYLVYLNGKQVADQQNSLYYDIKNLTPNTTYTVYVKARDKGGNTSASSATLQVTTSCQYPATIVDNKNYGLSSEIVFKEASNSVSLSSGFRYQATGNSYYIGKIVSCGPPSTHSARLDNEDLVTEVFEDNSIPRRDIELYPNPAKDVINLNLGEYYTNVHSVDIYNLSGMLMYAEAIKSSIHSFDLRDQANGIYILKLNYTDGKNEFIKFILSK